MSKRMPIVLLSVACSIAFSSLLLAAPSDEVVPDAEEAELEAGIEAEYQQAMAVAEKSQADAAEAMEKAREQLHLVAENLDTVKGEELSKIKHAEMAAMREELRRANRELRNASRKISQVNRELARARMSDEASSFVFSTGDRPVLGVILGSSNDVGIQVLGVSPDGPAERAGVAAGDVIVALGGRVLASVDETGNIRAGLNIALKDIKADEPVIVAVERGNDTLDFTVVPEVREPLSWQSVVRFPSAPSAPALAGGTIRIESIVVPDIDTEALTGQIEKMRIEIDERRALVGSAEIAPMVSHYNFQFDDMSELGDFALHNTNAWFGMPLASGLRLAAIDPGLGEYFKTDRGVLVLQAKEDNALLLQPGDVVLSLQGSDINSPADFMRALREFEPGDELVIDIKRKRKSKTLKPVIEESQARFFTPKSDRLHRITVTAESD